MDLKHIIMDINNKFKSKSLERDLAHVLLTTVVYHIWKERNNRTHNKSKLSKEQRWLIIESNNRVILHKSKKKVKDQTSLISLRIFEVKRLAVSTSNNISTIRRPTKLIWAFIRDLIKVLRSFRPTVSPILLQI